MKIAICRGVRGTYAKVTDLKAALRGMKKTPRSDNNLGYNRALKNVEFVLNQLFD